MRQIDPDFLSLPLRGLADAGLQRARELGAEYAAVRVERVRAETLRLFDARLEGAIDADDLGLAVRVVKNGTWGFAAGITLTPEEAVSLAEQAVHVAEISAAVNREAIGLAPEAVYDDVTYVSAYDVDPFDVPLNEKVALLADWSRGMLGAVDHVSASLMQVKEQKFYADSAGTVTTQQRVRVHPQVTAMKSDGPRFDDMRTLAPPVGRGYEYLTGTGWDFPAELARIPELLAEKLAAPSVEAGAYDLVIEPSNLWLTIHESIGHATELDRALGYEAAYAGTSFATFDKLGSLTYGSKIMNVVGDRTAEHGLSTVGWDDEGVRAQSFDIVRDGLLVGYQLDRRMALMQGFGRSNGCAFADSPGHPPIQRMANVSLQPAENGPSTEELISGVERGLLVQGDKSWSIDMQRYNFQFTGQIFHKIENGKLAGQVRDVAYQATTTDFWRSMDAVGGPQTYVLGGAFNCGKGQPGQVAPVSHGAPSARFRDVRVLNTVQEGGK